MIKKLRLNPNNLLLFLLKIVLMKTHCFLVIVLFSFFTCQAQDQNLNLIIGTYTNNCENKGMYVYDFNTQTADFKLKSTSENVINPSYLSVSKDSKFVYCVNENGDKSTVSAFEFHPESGNLKFLNQLSSEGADPCYIINDDKNVIVSTYSGGTISVFGKNTDGSIFKTKQSVEHKGSSINTKRQEKSHLHMVQFSPDKKYLFANDLGTDYIYVYNYRPESQRVLDIQYAIKVKPGSGPRHLTFSRDGKFVYLIQELDGRITVFDYNNGNLRLVQEASVVQKKFKGETSAADIHISPDGRFLYATNRGTANDITCFEIRKNGKLKWKSNTNTLGKGPRNFTIDPSGNLLLVAHQYSNDVVIFKINKQTGALTATDKKIELCSPVCLVFSL